MKQFLILFSSLVLIVSCNSSKGNMLVKGKINGFQKGTLFLEKIKDTSLLRLDSVVITAADNGSFELFSDVSEPEIYFLSIGNSNKKIQFFAEKGIINIFSDVKTFGYNPKITGSKNQEILDIYNKTNRKFTSLNLDLIKEKFDANTIRDKTTREKEIAKVEKKRLHNIRRKYLYTINFAVKNANHEVAPYLVLTEIGDTNPKLLDTVVKSFSPKITKSLYGKKLIDYLKK